MSKHAVVALALLALVALGCSPGSEPTSVSGFDTVITVFSDQADFAHAFTFALADTVFHPGPEGSSDDIPRTYDKLILDRVRADLVALGWTEIPNPDATHQPDAGVQVGVTTSDHVGWSYWPPYWGWYPGYPGYGWGYGGYYPSYSYTTGSVLMAMLDLKHPNPDTQTVPVMWLGAVNGVAGSTSSNQTRIVNGIDQAFKQSPYLQK